jgi:hypothetical protein
MTHRPRSDVDLDVGPHFSPAAATPVDLPPARFAGGGAGGKNRLASPLTNPSSHVPDFVPSPSAAPKGSSVPTPFLREFAGEKAIYVFSPVSHATRSRSLPFGRTERLERPPPFLREFAGERLYVVSPVFHATPIAGFPCQTSIVAFSSRRGGPMRGSLRCVYHQRPIAVVVCLCVCLQVSVVLVRRCPLPALESGMEDDSPVPSTTGGLPLRRCLLLDACVRSHDPFVGGPERRGTILLARSGMGGCAGHDLF